MSELIDRQTLDRAFTQLRFDSDGKLAHWGDRKDWCLHGSEVEKLISDAPTIPAPRWHRVEERLPKPGEYVLAWERQGFCVVDRYIDIDDGRWGLSNDGAIYTHWMPLPEPPKEDA